MKTLQNTILSLTCILGSSGCPNQENQPIEPPSQNSTLNYCGDTVYYFETRGGVQMCLNDRCLISCREAIREGINAIMTDGQLNQ